MYEFRRFYLKNISTAFYLAVEKLTEGIAVCLINSEMRNLITWVLILMTQTLHSQEIIPFTQFESFKKEALQIMDTLGIPPRQIYSEYDRPPVLRLVNFPQVMSEYQLLERKSMASDTSKKVFTKSEICISPIMYRWLSAEPPQRDYWYHIVHSSVLHEVVHHFQTPESVAGYIDPNKDYQAYLDQPVERDAQSVEAYYFFSNYETSELSEVRDLAEGNMELFLRELRKRYMKKASRPPMPIYEPGTDRTLLKLSTVPQSLKRTLL